MGTEVPNFFAVEGLDGVGKSTVVNELVKNGYTVLTTPPTEFKKFRGLKKVKHLIKPSIVLLKKKPVVYWWKPCP